MYESFFSSETKGRRASKDEGGDFEGDQTKDSEKSDEGSEDDYSDDFEEEQPGDLGKSGVQESDSDSSEDGGKEVTQLLGTKKKEVSGR